MNYLKNEEQKFKSLLKKKISFNLQTLVNILITGTVSLSLTACSGSGGSNNTENLSYNRNINRNIGRSINRSTNINTKNLTTPVDIINKNFINNGNIDINHNTNYALFAKNSSVTNNGNININSKIFVTNNSINSNGQIGILADNSNVTNAGIITVNTVVDSPIYTGLLYSTLPFSTAMKGENRSILENKNLIKGNGNTIGMDVNSDSVATNNGEITLSSQKINGDIIYEQGNDYHSNYNGYIYTDVIGMRGNGDNTKVINNKNINIDGQGVGVLALNKGEGVNTGSINLTSGELHLKQTVHFNQENVSAYGLGKSWAQVVGLVSDHSKITNSKSGTIVINGYGSGMYGRNDSSLVNDGIIDINGRIQYWTDNVLEGSSNIPNNYIYSAKLPSYGMKIENGGSLVNNGEIIFLTEYYVSSLLNNQFSLAEYSAGIYAKNAELVSNEKDGVIAISGSSAGMMGEQGSNLQNNGRIIINSGIETIQDKYNKDILGTIGMITDTGTIINNGEILSNSNAIADNVTGIFVQEGSVTNNGKISLNGKNVVGILDTTGKTVNNGEISIIGTKLEAPFGDFDLEKFIEKISTGIKVKNSETSSKESVVINNPSGSITLSDSAIGIYSKNSDLENAGTINLINSNDSRANIPNLGIIANGGQVINTGKIIGGSNSSSGMVTFNDGTVVNGANGIIDLKGIYTEGMSTLDGGLVVNKGKIIVEGENADGMSIDQGMGINSKEITIIGKDASGMKTSTGGTIINEEGATINVGAGANGMVAVGLESRAENYGTINVSVDAEGGVRAWEGGTAINYGTIVIDKNHKTSDKTTGMSKEQIAIFADGYSKIENRGKIVTDGNVTIEAGGTYVVKTDSDGSFGKLTAENVELDGNVLITSDIALGDYDSSYNLDTIIEGEKINTGTELSTLSDSLLYDASTSMNESGNLDGNLTRNDNSISNFVDENLSEVGSLLDKYLTKENYKKLSYYDKGLLDKVFINTTSEEKIKESVEKLIGREYLNISKQIFDIKDSFKKYDTSVISTLDKYNFNFALIGDYENIQSKDEVLGYDSKMTGFNGALKLSDNLYGNLGYGYSNIDYDKGAKGKIQTIHASIYKDYNYNKTNLRFGLFSEYNFHEIDRENLNGKVNVDFNSYLIGVTGEVAKKYGDTFYFEPKLVLDVAYGNVENFNEHDNLKIMEQNYTSIVPKVELVIGKKFNKVELFTKSSYSYELGDLDKDLDIKILNNNIGIKNNSIDKENLALSIGTNLNFESISLNAEVGKDFGKRDREYIKAGISYKF